MNIIINLIINFLCFIKKHKTYTFHKNKIKLNLGSHLFVYKDWINIDMNPYFLLKYFPGFIINNIYKIIDKNIKEVFSKEEFTNILKKHTLILYNLNYSIPFHDNSIDYIYASHFLEHFTKSKGLFILKEIYRILKPNGLVRISIPDLEYIIDLYNKNKQLEALDLLYMDSKNINSLHKYMYNFDLLKKILKDIGFKNVKKCDFQKGDMPDIESLDNRPIESLFIEARK